MRNFEKLEIELMEMTILELIECRNNLIKTIEFYKMNDLMGIHDCLLDNLHYVNTEIRKR